MREDNGTGQDVVYQNYSTSSMGVAGISNIGSGAIAPPIWGVVADLTVAIQQVNRDLSKPPIDKQLASGEYEQYLYNQQEFEDEDDDELLLLKDILPHAMEEAMNSPTEDDWVQHLNDL